LLCIYTLLPYLNTRYVFFIHHFRFDIHVPYFKYIISIFSIHLLHLCIFNTYYVQMYRFNQPQLAFNVRACRERVPGSRLEKYVHSMQSREYTENGTASPLTAFWPCTSSVSFLHIATLLRAQLFMPNTYSITQSWSEKEWRHLRFELLFGTGWIGRFVRYALALFGMIYIAWHDWSRVVCYSELNIACERLFDLEWLSRK
jgi:hypothetical protein